MGWFLVPIQEQQKPEQAEFENLYPVHRLPELFVFVLSNSELGWSRAVGRSGHGLWKPKWDHKPADTVEKEITLHLTRAEYKFFSSEHGILSMRDPILDHTHK